MSCLSAHSLGLVVGRENDERVVRIETYRRIDSSRADHEPRDDPSLGGTRSRSVSSGSATEAMENAGGNSTRLVWKLVLGDVDGDLDWVISSYDGGLWHVLVSDGVLVDRAD